MFGKMRQELRSAVYYLWWVLLIALVAPSFFQRIGGMDPQKQAVITVNGDPLTVQQFKRQYSMMQSERMMFNQRYGLNLDTNIDPVVVLNRGSEGLLLDAIAQTQGYSIDPAVLGFMIKNSLAEALGFDKKLFNMNFYAYYVRQIGMTIREFEQDQEVMVKRALVDEAVRAAAYAPEFAKQASGKTKKSFKMLRFSKDAYLKDLKAESYSDEDLAAFYAENKESYKLPDTKSVEYFMIDPRRYEKDVTVSEEQVQAFYDLKKDAQYKEKDQYKMRRLLITVPMDATDAEVAAFKQKAEDLVQKATSKQDDFADLVTKASDDEKTAKKGGMTEAFSPGTYAPELEAELVKLAQVGDITPVVRTADGFECAQLVSKQLGSYKKLESVRKEIISALTKKTAHDRLKADIDSALRPDAEGEVDISSLAKDLNLNVETTGDLDASMAHGESIKAELAKKVFGSFMAKAVSRGSFVFNDKHVVFAVNASATDRYQALEDIKSKVSQDLMDKKAQQALDENVTSAQKAFFDGEYSFETVAKEFPGHAVYETGMMHAKDSVKGFDKEHGLTEKLFKLEASSMLARIQLKNGDVLLACLADSEEVPGAEAASKDDSKGLESVENNLMRGFVATLKRNARIDIVNQDFFAAQ